MAIKRSSKSLGNPVRRSVSSPGLRHIDLLAPRQMVPGNTYVGWLCKNKSCGRVMAVAAEQAGKPGAHESDDQLAALKCPHCGDEDLYRWSARGEHTYSAANTPA